MTTPRRPRTTVSKAPRAASSRADSPRRNPPRIDSPRRNPRASADLAALLMQYFDSRFPNAFPDSPQSRARREPARKPRAPRQPAPQQSIKRSTRVTKKSSPQFPTKPIPTYQEPAHQIPAHPAPTHPEPAAQASAPAVSTPPPATASSVAAPILQLARSITAELGRAYYAYVALADRLLDDVAKQNPPQVNTAQVNPAQQTATQQTPAKRNPTKRQASQRTSAHRRLAPGPTSLLLALGDAEARTAAEPSLAPDPHPGLTVGTLAERTRLASSTVAGLLARLERERLIERTRPACDQRLVYVQLTDEARRLVPQLRTTDELLAELTTAALQPPTPQQTTPQPTASEPTPRQPTRQQPATQSTRPKTTPARTVAALTQTLARLSSLTATFQEAAGQLTSPRPEPESQKLHGPIADLIEPTEAEVQQLLAQLRAEQAESKRLADYEG